MYEVIDFLVYPVKRYKPLTITLMNVSALMNCQIFSPCNCDGLTAETYIFYFTSPPPFPYLHVHLSVQVEPLLPYEYTCEGMLERLHAYIQNQVGHNKVIILM